jgi:hypothetical protein
MPPKGTVCPVGTGAKNMVAGAASIQAQAAPRAVTAMLPACATPGAF